MERDYQQALNLITDKNYPDALAILNALLEKDFTFADAYYQRGQVKEQLQDFLGAIADYTQVIYLNPTIKAYLSIALIKFAQGDFSSVITNTKAAISLDQSSPLAHRLLAQAYQQQNQVKAAIDTYKKAIRCYLEKEDKKNARYCFEQIEKLTNNTTVFNVNFVDNKNSIVSDYLQQAVAKVETKNYYAALTDLNWLLKIEPCHPEALCCRGLIAAKLGNSQAAITDFAQAIQLEPHNKKWQYQRGIARLDLADAYGALQEFTELLKQEPTNSNYLLYRGKAYLQLQRYDEAFKDYANALAIEPNNGELYLACAELQEILKNTQEALVDYQKAAMIFFNQGNHQKQQKIQAKIKSLQARIRQQPEK